MWHTDVVIIVSRPFYAEQKAEFTLVTERIITHRLFYMWDMGFAIPGLCDHERAYDRGKAQPHLNRLRPVVSET
jgi:hypothetical protein